MILNPHSENWQQEFSCLQSYYKSLLKDSLLRVEHVGSTAITGIAAKPILDIDLVITASTNFATIKAALEGVGYRHLGDLDIAGREAFKRLTEDVPYAKSRDHWMDHHLYVCNEDSRELKRHILFRDYLNSHQAARREYERIKKSIEEKAKGDRKRYAEIKEHEGECSAFVEKVLCKANEAITHKDFT